MIHKKQDKCCDELEWEDSNLWECSKDEKMWKLRENSKYNYCIWEALCEYEEDVDDDCYVCDCLDDLLCFLGIFFD